ncbi:hypothetical protein HYC85_010857 [Camellia sinensis]|uniref:SPX domain-containing protein n=1 Tax=Camellia sinensis TaxID=4442 RepID=A0A7J7HJ82_CAMSI|nr:hypothetical protein HYC85_010857 [Camellia sinensis]
MPRGRDWTSDGHNGDAVEQGVGEAADLWVAPGPEVATCGWRRGQRWRCRRWGGNGIHHPRDHRLIIVYILSYKDLKKIVRLISPASSMMEGSHEHGKTEEDFVYLLDNEIGKFNAFFMEQEEDFVISHKELQRRIQRVIDIWGPNGSLPSEEDYKEKMGRVRKDTVNFHGEMVLLMNYSNVNYTGLVKILKKYDKRTGGLLRSPYIQKVLHQPFLRTDVILKLVKECESTTDTMFPVVEEKGMREGKEEIEVSSEGIFKTTIIALLTMQEIRKASSTYRHFSLPPLNLSDFDIIKFFQLYSYIIFP